MSQKSKKEGLGCYIALLILVIIIFAPVIINLISNSIKNSIEVKHEEKLIEEGKTKTDSEVINEIIEIFENRDKEKINQYLSEDFIYYNNDNIKSEFISGFWSDLNYYTGKYYIEPRGDTSNQENKTFCIYWDIPEQIEYKQYSQYSLQKICIYMKRIVKEDIITYEIEKIILTNN